MSEPGSRRGRVHDAEGAREAILNAAEVVFAEHGFDGARVDAIAEQAGYNKSLIFQYFGDKLNLYVEVLKRIDQELNDLTILFYGAQDAALDAFRFKTMLETIVGTLFDYLVANPRLMRMLLWEMAESWQTYIKIYSRFTTDDLDRARVLFREAHRLGLLRSNFTPLVQLSMIIQVCQTYLAYQPLYQLMVPDEDFSSPEALARAREYVVTFVVAGIMFDIPDTKP